MKIAFCVFVVLCLINVSIVLSLHSPKSCAEFAISPMQNFVKELYVGDWFIHQQYDFPGSQGYDCFVLMRTLRPDGNIKVTQVLLKPGVLPEVRADGLQTFNHPGVGRYTYTSADNPGYHGNEYIILETDYNKYTVECKCTDVSGGSIVEFYVMIRDPTVSHFTQDHINEFIIAHQFDDHEIRTLNITSCPSELTGSDGLLVGLLKLVTRLFGRLLGG